MCQDFLFLQPTKKCTMKKSKWTALAVIGIALYACAPKVVTPPVAPKEVAVAEPVKTVIAEPVKEMVLTPELAKGKSLYEDSCAHCHKLFPTTKHDKEGWVATLDRMAPKAKISEEDKKMIYNYLVAGL